MMGSDEKMPRNVEHGLAGRCGRAWHLLQMLINGELAELALAYFSSWTPSLGAHQGHAGDARAIGRLASGRRHE